MSASDSSTTMITVPATELREDVFIPRSTFESEVKRLRLQAEAMDRDWGDGKYLTRKIKALVKLLYGKKCWVCKEQITVYFDGSQPILRPVHPDDTDGKQHPLHREIFCAECWRNYQRQTYNKRRRITEQAKRVAVDPINKRRRITEQAKRVVVDPKMNSP